MSVVSVGVKGGGRHEFSCRRLERMLKTACRNFDHGLGLKDSDIGVGPDGPISSNGGVGALQLAIHFSDDIMNKLAPKIDPEKPERSDVNLRRFVQTLGETAVRLGPENGWPQRQVRVTAPLGISWSG